ncbi:superoxide dismutase family protein [Polyangium sp. y55x31]|uniref:superoxide dismutase family protein n=1 Tax=Polyangium sp. y55x31 TaxID=3042688 RepID=UPI0024832A34|nr:superoxide dismutase family protein [Polyangium sp. y55x31]MDI1477646.1 superoxide dismutase family protein [Polyangium sp. y55x31]
MTKKGHPFAVLGTCVLAVLCGCSDNVAEKPEGVKAAVRATAEITPSTGQSVTGTAVFTEENGFVRLTLRLNGLVPGAHAVHIHEMPDCGMDGNNAMGHWNPTNEAHGKWGRPPFHRGDIGNVTADAMGKASLTLRTDLWTLGDESTTDVVNHAFMVHADPDDFTSQPAGNAGARIGCGVIKLNP